MSVCQIEERDAGRSYPRTCPSCGLGKGGCVKGLDREGLRAHIAALEAQLDERVKVKPLEWTRGWMNAEAQTEIGQYTITYRRDGSFEWGIGILKGWASSWDEAKAAAQADFEHRILSALEATLTAAQEPDQ